MESIKTTHVHIFVIMLQVLQTVLLYLFILLVANSNHSICNVLFKCNKIALQMNLNENDNNENAWHVRQQTAHVHQLKIINKRDAHSANCG